MKLDATPMTSWYFQEFNPLLPQVGELKVVIVNKSKVLGRMICRPASKLVDVITSPEETTETVLWATPVKDIKLQ